MSLFRDRLGVGLAALFLMTFATPLRANAIYNFTATSTTGSAGTAIAPVNFTLTLPDSIVLSGGYNASRTCTSYGVLHSCEQSTGDFTGVSLYSTGYAGLVDGPIPDPAYDRTIYSLIFDGAGDIVSGSIVADTASWTVSINLAAGGWSASFNSDAMGACWSGMCQASGFVSDTPLPEPSSLMFMGLGLIGIGGCWRGRLFANAG